jgi:hypothetical protein
VALIEQASASITSLMVQLAQYLGMNSEHYLPLRVCWCSAWLSAGWLVSERASWLDNTLDRQEALMHDTDE